jgi:DNA-binding transcriptional MerR regulator
MTDVQLDIIQIKQTLKDMQKNIAKIKQYLQDEYFEDKIDKLYDAAENRNNQLQAKRQKIDEEINYYIQLKEQNYSDSEIMKFCEKKLAELLDEDIDITLEMNDME